MTAAELEAIRARWAASRHAECRFGSGLAPEELGERVHVLLPDGAGAQTAAAFASDDVAALVAEVERLREGIAAFRSDLTPRAYRVCPVSNGCIHLDCALVRKLERLLEG